MPYLTPEPLLPLSSSYFWGEILDNYRKSFWDASQESLGQLSQAQGGISGDVQGQELILLGPFQPDTFSDCLIS